MYTRRSFQEAVYKKERHILYLLLKIRISRYYAKAAAGVRRQTSTSISFWHCLKDKETSTMKQLVHDEVDSQKSDCRISRKTHLLDCLSLLGTRTVLPIVGKYPPNFLEQKYRVILFIFNTNYI